MSSYPVALTIAGSDSGGGAGIQADLKSFHRLGVFGASVITALTAQNSVKVEAVQPVDTDFVAAQMETVFSDIKIAAVKTGMLFNSQIISVVADALQRHSVSNLVVDPVMVATSGDTLLQEDAVQAYKKKLLPHTALLTPNLHEASVLAGRSVSDINEMKEAALEIAEFGVRAVLIKGGHNISEEAVDLLFYDGSFELLSAASVVKGGEFHGSGCTLSAAITAFLALGYSIPDACREAKEYISRAINGAFHIGSGSFVLDHWA